MGEREKRERERQVCSDEIDSLEMHFDLSDIFFPQNFETAKNCRKSKHCDVMNESRRRENPLSLMFCIR